VVGKFIKGQPALPSISSRQCRCSATFRTAGFHIAAFESPTTATVVVEPVSPVAQSGWLTCQALRRQPLT